MSKYAKSPPEGGAQKFEKMADGGDVGLFERLRAGNIDDPKSEAYRRWGAGSKSVPDSKEAVAPAPAPAPDPTPVKDEPSNATDYSDSLPTSTESYQTKAEPKDSSPAPAPKPKSSKKASAPAPSPSPSPAPSPAPASRPSFNDTRDWAGTQTAKDNESGRLPGGRDYSPLDAIKSIFSSGPVTPARKYVDGGMIGNVSVDSPGPGRQSFKKDALANPMQNTQGGGPGSMGRDYKK
jgi:hypothetical protein